MNDRPKADISPAAAHLCLRVALYSASRPTRLGKADWEWIIRDLTPREVATVALRIVWGMDFEAIGQWLGVSRGRADQHWRSALLKMRHGLEGRFNE